MSFYDFSTIWEFIGNTGAITWIVGISLIIIVLFGSQVLYRIYGRRLDLILKTLEVLLTIFFLILALPSLIIATIESGNDPRKVILALIALMLVHFARMSVARAESLDDIRGMGTKSPSSEEKDEGWSLASTCAVGVLVGLTTLVLLRRRKASQKS